ncbi:MAG: DUF1080 domain-containing protein, partial [Anaerolineae bacterium]|nr:DUF1080 domain-containing protein [Anaerolineae bacterium]
TYRVDDFSNPDSGWPVGYQSDNVYTEYLASEYHVTHSGSGGGFRYFNNWQSADYWLEVDVRQARDNDSHHGLVFGQDTDAAAFDFYYFAINSHTNRYHLTRWAANPDDVKTLVSGSSDAIKSGTALNHLEVECVGSQIKLWINGIQVAQVDDSMFVGNRLVGLSTSVWTDEVYFDNFALCTYAQ